MAESPGEFEEDVDEVLRWALEIEPTKKPGQPPPVPEEDNLPMVTAVSLAIMSKEELLAARIDSLDLTLRVKKALAKMGEDTVGHLCACTESYLCANPHLGRGGTDEIIDFLTRNGLTLALHDC